MKKIVIKLLHKCNLLFFSKVLIMICHDINKYFRVLVIKIKWRSFNKHNHTFVVNSAEGMHFPLDRVTVGRRSYGPLSIFHFNANNEKLVIGHYCSISTGVKFILGGNNTINTFLTFPIRFFLAGGETEAQSNGPIRVEDDVWIGTDAIILSGVTLARGTVIAAGSVVTKSTQPYSVNGGVPAKLIKYRFADSMINSLMDIDFENINDESVLNCLSEICSPMNHEILVKIKESC